MKAATKIILGLLLVLLICKNSYAEDLPTLRTFGHLCPEESVLDDYDHSYYAVIGKAFRKYRYESGVLSMLAIPSFESEWLVGLKKEDTKDVVFLVRAKEQIRRYNKDLSKLPDNLMEESSAEIDADTAQLLTGLWEAMLLDTRYPRRIFPGHDGTRYHFSLGLRTKETRGYFTGYTNTPEDNTRPGILVNIGELLADYAKAKPDKRDEILTNIRAKAGELQKRLKADKTTTE